MYTHIFVTDMLLQLILHDNYTMLTPNWLSEASLQLLAMYLAVNPIWHSYTYNMQGNWKYGKVSYYAPTSMRFVVSVPMCKIMLLLSSTVAVINLYSYLNQAIAWFLKITFVWGIGDVCVCVCVRVRACVRVCVDVHVHVFVHMCVYPEAVNN